MNLDPASSSLPMEATCALALMAKVPFAGAVKTRLTPPLSSAEAATLSMCFLRDMTTNMASLSGDRTRPIVLYTPGDAEIDLTVDLLPTWYDVDDAATLRLLCEELSLLSDGCDGEAQFRGGFEAPYTRNYLAGLIAKEGDERFLPGAFTAKTRA